MKGEAPQVGDRAIPPLDVVLLVRRLLGDLILHERVKIRAAGMVLLREPDLVPAEETLVQQVGIMGREDQLCAGAISARQELPNDESASGEGESGASSSSITITRLCCTASSKGPDSAMNFLVPSDSSDHSKSTEPRAVPYHRA